MIMSCVSSLFFIAIFQSVTLLVHPLSSLLNACPDKCHSLILISSMMPFGFVCSLIHLRFFPIHYSNS